MHNPSSNFSLFSRPHPLVPVAHFDQQLSEEVLKDGSCTSSPSPTLPDIDNDVGEYPSFLGRLELFEKLVALAYPTNDSSACALDGLAIHRAGSSLVLDGIGESQTRSPEHGQMVFFPVDALQSVALSVLDCEDIPAEYTEVYDEYLLAESPADGVRIKNTFLDFSQRLEKSQDQLLRSRSSPPRLRKDALNGHATCHSAVSDECPFPIVPRSSHTFDHMSRSGLANLLSPDLGQEVLTPSRNVQAISKLCCLSKADLLPVPCRLGRSVSYTVGKYTIALGCDLVVYESGGTSSVDWSAFRSDYVALKVIETPSLRKLRIPAHLKRSAWLESMLTGIQRIAWAFTTDMACPTNKNTQVVMTSTSDLLSDSEDDNPWTFDQIERLLYFLQARCETQGGTYWLFRDTNRAGCQLYSVPMYDPLSTTDTPSPVPSDPLQHQVSLREQASDTSFVSPEIALALGVLCFKLAKGLSLRTTQHITTKRALLRRAAHIFLYHPCSEAGDAGLMAETCMQLVSTNSAASASLNALNLPPHVGGLLTLESLSVIEDACVKARDFPGVARDAVWPKDELELRLTASLVNTMVAVVQNVLTPLMTAFNVSVAPSCASTKELVFGGMSWLSMRLWWLGRCLGALSLVPVERRKLELWMADRKIHELLGASFQGVALTLRQHPQFAQTLLSPLDSPVSSLSSIRVWFRRRCSELAGHPQTEASLALLAGRTSLACTATRGQKMPLENAMRQHELCRDSQRLRLFADAEERAYSAVRLSLDIGPQTHHCAENVELLAKVVSLLDVMYVQKSSTKAEEALKRCADAVSLSSCCNAENLQEPGSISRAQAVQAHAFVLVGRVLLQNKEDRIALFRQQRDLDKSPAPSRPDSFVTAEEYFVDCMIIAAGEKALEVLKRKPKKSTDPQQCTNDLAREVASWHFVAAQALGKAASCGQKMLLVPDEGSLGHLYRSWARPSSGELAQLFAGINTSKIRRTPLNTLRKTHCHKAFSEWTSLWENFMDLSAFRALLVSRMSMARSDTEPLFDCRESAVPVLRPDYTSKRSDIVSEALQQLNAVLSLATDYLCRKPVGEPDESEEVVHCWNEALAAAADCCYVLDLSGRGNKSASTVDQYCRPMGTWLRKVASQFELLPAQYQSSVFPTIKRLITAYVKSECTALQTALTQGKAHICVPFQKRDTLLAERLVCSFKKLYAVTLSTHVVGTKYMQHLLASLDTSGF